MTLRGEDVVAIDIHAHMSDERAMMSRGHRAKQMAAYFGSERKVVTAEEMADAYRARKMMAVLMNSTDVTTSGHEPVPNEHIAKTVQAHPDVFVGFGALEPQLGKVAVEEVKRIADLGLRGVGELNPGRQQFFPNDPACYPIWAEAQRLGLVVLFHSGMMGAGAGTPGGRGYKLKYGHPIPYVDDVAADFPELRIISAHPSWPWQSESLAMARHKSNVYIDLSGWAPKYFPAELVQYATTILQDRVLFGSDWPAIPVERWIEEFDQLAIKPEIRRKILLENAKALLRLG
jgi:predicted TIM-barrel fold metal-dependent hydrolase